jgi:hypothetical protein
MTENNEFLPLGYEVPSSADGYMKFEQGDNRFRILCSPILGWEYWVTDSEGKRKPLRKRMEQPFSTLEVEEPESIKHFWAMVVYNYNTEKIQILEITQKGIQKILRALAKDKDWGTPVQTYDIVVNKTGEKLETKYEVLPKPIKKIDPGIVAAYEALNINLHALYDGADPFADVEDKETEDIVEDAVRAGL